MKLVQKRSKKTGLPPGTLVHIGERKSEKVTVAVFRYSTTSCEELQVEQVDQLSPPADESVIWINVGGVHKVEMVEMLGKQFSLHPLLLEDVTNTDQRPKLDDYEAYIFLVMKMLSLTDRKEIAVEQVSCVLGKNYVISFQENGTDVFQPVRERLRGGKGRLRQSGADYLLYALVDAIVDQYFAVLEHIGEKIEAVQQAVVDDPKPETLNEIHALKRQLLFVRRAVWPLRDVMTNLSRSDCPFLQDSHQAVLPGRLRSCRADRRYHRNTSRHGLGESRHLSVECELPAQHVMRVLTVITTIFMPLSFIASIYGMNFEYMPELRSPWGYPLVLGVMAAVGVGMLVLFRNKRWL